MGKYKELVVSWIRTSVVPPTAALILTWLAQRNIQLPDTTVYWFVTLFLSGVWYVIFRGIEILSENPKVKKWAGIFLGYPRSEVKTFGPNN